MTEPRIETETAERLAQATGQATSTNWDASKTAASPPDNEAAQVGVDERTRAALAQHGIGKVNTGELEQVTNLPIPTKDGA